MNCGCTMQRPVCAIGEELFVTLTQSYQRLYLVGNRGQLWEDFSDARLAYTDHIHQWRQGDVRVRNEGGIWLLERRQREEWAFQFGMIVEGPLRAWLKEQGFWRYTQIDDGGPRDRLTGYYHQRVSRVSQARNTPENALAITRPLEQDMQQEVSDRVQRTGESVGVNVDQKTELALLIAVLVGCHAQPLTAVDRLYIQRQAVDVLLSRGVQPVGADDVKTIATLTNAAISVRDMLQRARKSRLF